MGYLVRRVLPLVVLALGAWGCSSKSADPEEEAVRKAFADFQAALKARDPEKIWGLLDDDSRAEADRAAKDIHDAYAKADAAGKAETEKALGLSAAELAALDGKGFLKTSRFHGKYHEVPDSKVEKVVVQGDKATLTYVEEDGDKEKLSFVKQAGQWKVSVPMPKGG
jgi:hypothetical protein